MPLRDNGKRKGPRLKGDPKPKTSLKMIHFKFIFRLGKIRIVISNY